MSYKKTPNVSITVAIRTEMHDVHIPPVQMEQLVNTIRKQLDEDGFDIGRKGFTCEKTYNEVLPEDHEHFASGCVVPTLFPLEEE